MRPLRVSFDNNFIDEFEKAPPEARAHILDCVARGRLEIYASELILKELMGLGEIRLPGLCREVLKWTRGRMLATPQTILESELKGKPLFLLDEEARVHFVKYLTLIANGAVQKSAAGIGQKALAEKQTAMSELRKYVPILENRPDGITDQKWTALRASRKTKRKRISFDDVRAAWTSKNGRKHLEMNYAQWGLANPAETADRMLKALRSHPRHAAWLASHAIPAYYYSLLGEPVDKGDLFDHRLLVYGYDMDVFLTQDKRLREWFALLFGDKCRPMTAQEFFAQQWC